MIDFLKFLLCYLLAQCYDPSAHRDMQRIAMRVDNLEREIARERSRYWKPRDTFGG